MSNTSSRDLDLPDDSADKEFLYSVLNLPTTASIHEIRERYKQLSMIFHPDKQRDESTKETAARRFLEVQKAYLVLSDPVSRQAYDAFGEQGLRLLKDSQVSGELSAEEIRAEITRNQQKADRLRFQNAIYAKGQIAVGVDASSLFQESPEDEYYGFSWYQGLGARIRAINRMHFGLRHSVEKSVNEKTNVVLKGRMNVGSAGSLTAASDFLGTVRHQYSSRLSFEATTSLLKLRSLGLKTTYKGDNNIVVADARLSTHLIHAFTHMRQPSGGLTIPIPPCSLSFSRRLYPRSGTLGTLTFSTKSRLPILSFAVSSASTFDIIREAGRPPTESIIAGRPPSLSGLATGVTYWNLGAAITGLTGEFGVAFAELGVQLRTMLRVGLGSWEAVLGAVWTGEDGSVGADVRMDNSGIGLALNFSYLEQDFHFPIILSHEFDVDLAFWITLVPSTALLLGYHLVLRPRRRRQRAEFLRQIRRKMREGSLDVLRRAEETVSLLQGTARKNMQTEIDIDGLVITEAVYGSTERGDDMECFDANVTIPIQALVHNSQLYIPGRRSKASLQGFYDPAPPLPKTLRIRYTFRGRAHYAEIPDYMPVALPLEDHLVE